MVSDSLQSNLFLSAPVPALGVSMDAFLFGVNWFSR